MFENAFEMREKIVEFLKKMTNISILKSRRLRRNTFYFKNREARC